MDLLIWFIIFGLISGAIGSRKGATISGFFVGLLLGPIGIIVTLVSKGDRVKCEHCKEYIDPEASKCPNCAGSLVNSHQS
jgi:hypothetical protein